MLNSTPEVYQKDGNKNTVPEYIFPEYIRNSEYVNRVMSLKVYEAGVLADSWEQIKKLATSKNITLEDALIETGNGNATAKKFLANIILPLPNELQEQISHGWGAETGIVKSLIESNGLTSGAASTADKILSRVSDKMNTRKPLIDPGYFQNYTGTEPRSFTFSFTFIPESEQEAKNALQLIMLLKKYSTPSGRAGILQSPHYFKLVFGSEEIHYMINPQDCVISDINLDYGSGSFVDMTVDGIPKMMKLSLTFKERRMIVSKDWETSLKKFNVGS